MCMTSVIFATHNPAKIARFKEPLAHHGYTVMTASDAGIPDVNPSETGDNEQENAAIKARGYFAAMTNTSQADAQTVPAVVSLDTGVYFEGVGDMFQPGKHVQRIAGAGAAGETDQQRYHTMIRFYSDLARRFDSALPGYFLDMFCLKTAHGEFFAQARRQFVLTSTVFQADVHFPLSSLYTVNDVPYHSLSPQQMADFIQPSVEALVDLLQNNGCS